VRLLASRWSHLILNLEDVISLRQNTALSDSRKTPSAALLSEYAEIRLDCLHRSTDTSELVQDCSRDCHDKSLCDLQERFRFHESAVVI
jgi:hypothetical protein